MVLARCRTAAVVAALGTPALLATSASANVPYVPTGQECQYVVGTPSTDQGQALADSTGLSYDIATATNYYATLEDGVSSSGVNDAYDDWGGLYVGDVPSTSTQYTDTDPLGCSTEAGGRQIVYKAVTMGGLTVQRRIFVSSTGAGVRFLDSVTNPTGAPITTGVFVGDTTSNRDGDLGSDGATQVIATSSGALVPSTADTWAVTDDGRTDGSSDPAVASVWGGTGAALPATYVAFGSSATIPTLDDPINSTVSADQVGWGWQGVTIPAGATVSFASWSLALADATTPGDATVQGPEAVQAAQALAAASPARLYEGLTPSQIASIRNWALPAVTATISPVSGATTTTDTALAATGIDFGAAAGASQCTTGTLSWDFGDGSSATGASVTHRFTAGTAHVTLTATSQCGGTVTRTADFTVAAPPAVTPTPTPAPTPAAPATALAPSLNAFVAPKLSAAYFRRFGAAAIVTPTVAGSVRLAVTAGSAKLVTTQSVPAGKATTLRVTLPRQARGVIAGLTKLEYRLTYTVAGGNKQVKTFTVPVTH